MRKGFFVTGTDTGVGKTIVSAILTLALDAFYWKPIQSGLADEIADVERVRQLTGLAAQHFLPSQYNLSASLAPQHAAALENITIDLAQCTLPTTNKKYIVEGAGGVCVPVNDQLLMLDLMQQLNLPVVIVSRGTLGTINHTLLTIAALRQRQLPIQGVIFCGELNLMNQQTIEQHGGVRTLLHVPAFPVVNQHVLQQWVQAQREKILAELNYDYCSA